MKEQGFTLVELLAVIIVMGVVFGLVTTNITNVVNKTADKEYDLLSNMLEKMAQIYVKNAQPTELDTVGGTYCVTIQNLADEGLITLPITDPRDDIDFSLTTCVYVEKTSSNAYLYDFNSSLEYLRLIVVGDNPATVACAASGNYSDPGADPYDADNLAAANVYSPDVVNLQDAGEYEMDYSYTNGNNETVTKERTVTVTNTNIPTITVTGGTSRMIVIQNSGFTPRAATATDPCEGSVAVEITSNVIPTLVGKYSVTYKAPNAAGLTNIITIEVTVAPTLDTSGANAPELETNMIPVYWDTATSVWKKADSTNLSTTYKWYDYDEKRWANAVVVTSTNRATYLAAANGTTISMTDILGFFTWIPRYKYMIPAATGARTITIAFENGTPTKSTGNAITSYRTHPAFTFGTTEETGLWFSKFEVGYYGATDEVTAQQNVTTANKIIIKPSVWSWRDIQPAHAYLVGRGMQGASNIYGLATTGLDTHFILNVEWGAVAYLTYSKYGFGEEVWLNPNAMHITGCAGEFADDPTYVDACTNSYSTVKGVKASTTGNIYGVYDMSGGAYDMVMGNLLDYSGNDIDSNSNFNGYCPGDLSTYSAGYAFPASKYYSRFTAEDETAACAEAVCYGQALSETMEWNEDTANSASPNYPWISRGGTYGGDNASGVFNYDDFNGADSTSYGFRIAIAPTP